MNVMLPKGAHPDAEEHSIPAPVSGLTADPNAISAKTGAAASVRPRARLTATPDRQCPRST